MQFSGPLSRAVTVVELAVRSTMQPADVADDLRVFRSAIDENYLCELFFTALEITSYVINTPLHNHISVEIHLNGRFWVGRIAGATG
jgi:hypothetical protein